MSVFHFYSFSFFYTSLCAILILSTDEIEMFEMYKPQCMSADQHVAAGKLAASRTSLDVAGTAAAAAATATLASVTMNLTISDQIRHPQKKNISLRWIFYVPIQYCIIY